MWALQTWAGAAPPPCAGARRAQGQPQTAGEGTASPPCAVGMGAPQIPWSPSTHSSTRLPTEGLGVLLQPASRPALTLAGFTHPGIHRGHSQPRPPRRPRQPSGYFLPQEAGPSPGFDPANPTSPSLHPARWLRS